MRDIHPHPSFPFTSVDEIIRAHESRQDGNHFFRPAAMRFFRSRVSQAVYGGKYFVTSERREGCTRMYSVRKIETDFRISTVGDGAEYRTGRTAAAAARRLAARDSQDVAPPGNGI